MLRLRRNRILEKARQGKKAIGCGLVYPSEEAVEIVGMLGFDFISLDGEHGLFSPESIDAMCRIAEGYGMTVTARVPNILPSTINQYMDRGVLGILGPHVDTPEQAQQLVNACRFVPEGHRSWGGGRGTYYNSSELLGVPGSERTEWMAATNKEVLVMAQLETKTAMDNLDAILKVKGIDAFTWGPNDLAQSLGLPGQPDHPQVQQLHKMATEKIYKAGRKLQSDLMVALGVPNLIIDGARAFMAKYQ